MPHADSTAATRGTQMIFCDMGVHATPWGYSAYDDIIGKLVTRGIPRAQIATIGDADSDQRSQPEKARILAKLKEHAEEVGLRNDSEMTEACVTNPRPFRQ
jgi:hypothetical protein